MHPNLGHQGRAQGMTTDLLLGRATYVGQRSSTIEQRLCSAFVLSALKAAHVQHLTVC